MTFIKQIDLQKETVKLREEINATGSDLSLIHI